MRVSTRITSNRGPYKIRPSAIVLHWWDDPAKHPSLPGVVSWFLNPKSEVSAHYVVSGDEVIAMVPEDERAWHALSANDYAIGIEVDPNIPGNTLRTTGELVRTIRQRRGDLPLVRHRDIPGVSTSCPGTLNVELIERYARGEDMIPDEDAYYWRFGQDLASRIRGRILTRDEFRNALVGKSSLKAVEILSDDPEAAAVQHWQDIGKIAVRDRWEQQIYDFQAALKAAIEQVKELEKKTEDSELIRQLRDKLVKTEQELKEAGDAVSSAIADAKQAQDELEAES